jgi:hypothetical protein
MPVHETDLAYNRHAHYFCNHLINHGVITDTLLGGLTTVAGLIAAIKAVANVPFQVENLVRNAETCLNNAKNVGAITDAQVNTVGAGGGGTRIAALRAIFTGNDASLGATDAYTFAF